MKTLVLVIRKGQGGFDVLHNEKLLVTYLDEAQVGLALRAMRMALFAVGFTLLDRHE